MWPWEHAAAGYLLYSLGLRSLGEPPPSERETALLLLATQLPDLVDKPLSWGLGLFPSGHAVGHSAFVALPVGVAVWRLAARAGRRREGAAFVVGYWSHPAADVFAPLRLGDQPVFVRALWPLGDVQPYGTDLGLGRGVRYLSRFVETLVAEPTLAVVYLVVPLLALSVWLCDGAPGLATVRSQLSSLGEYTGRRNCR